eukprot:1153580-Pelagomonas_calceolata.AAC.2
MQAESAASCKAQQPAAPADGEVGRAAHMAASTAEKWQGGLHGCQCNCCRRSSWSAQGSKRDGHNRLMNCVRSCFWSAARAPLGLRIVVSEMDTINGKIASGATFGLQQALPLWLPRLTFSEDMTRTKLSV